MNGLLHNIFGVIASLTLNAAEVPQTPQQSDITPAEHTSELPKKVVDLLTLKESFCTIDIANPQFYTISTSPTAGQNYEGEVPPDKTPEGKLGSLASHSRVLALSISINHVFLSVADKLTAAMLADDEQTQALGKSLQHELAVQWAEQSKGRNPDIRINFHIVANPTRNGECVPGLDRRLPKYHVAAPTVTFSMT